MKKLFISQPMKDKTNDEIERARERAIREATEYIGEPVEIIDSFFKDAPHDAKPLWFLAESIRLMACRISFISPRVGRTHAAACERDVLSVRRSDSRT